MAAERVDGKPGVRVVARGPVVRRFRPRVYRVGAALSLVAAVQAVIVFTNDGVETPLVHWLVVPALGGVATLLAHWSAPWPHVRFPGADDSTSRS